MSADALLSHLTGVRRTGANRWVARCPAHDDRRPSLSVRELDDQRLLVHCFGGCTVEDVMAAAGLELSDLFPERALDDRKPRERHPFDARDVLRCVAMEAEIASTAADNIANGIGLTDIDRNRLRLAALRLSEARELADG